jgi:hypothetical protein
MIWFWLRAWFRDIPGLQLMRVMLQIGLLFGATFIHKVVELHATFVSLS